MAVKRYDGSAWQTVAGLGAQGAAATSSSIATWVKTASGGETSLSGNDDNSQSLSYTVGQELVFINGTLLKRGSDYTATNGTSITGLTALAANDVATVWTVNAFSVTNAISNTIMDAKGDLLTASSADVPARLAVGANNTVLTADSSTATGLKWASPSAGANWSLVNAGGTALTGAATITVSGISGADKIMVLLAQASAVAATTQMSIRFNGDTASNYYMYGQTLYWSSTYDATNYDRVSGAYSEIWLGTMGNNVGNSVTGHLLLSGGNSSGVKMYQAFGSGSGTTGTWFFPSGYYNSSSTISSVTIKTDGSNFDAGTIYVYTSA